MANSRVLFLIPIFGLIVVGVTLGLYACGGGGGSSSPAPKTAVSSFPLQIGPSNRYLVDAAGKPFLMHGESAYSLISQATDAQVDQYLADRQQKGFNTIWVGLIDHKFADQAPSNNISIPGNPPFDGVVASFTIPSDFSKPDEAYFAHADSVIQKAADKGFLVLLSPAYLGYGCGSSNDDEGWYQELAANNALDVNRLRNYGRYLGQRYAKFSNILWLNGGDCNPPDPTIVRNIALGIKDFDTHSLHSGHCAQESSAFQCWGTESWLQVNDTYTYADVNQTALTEYQRAPSMPVFLVEGRYENEDINNGNGTEQQVRVQAYQALLSGEMGQVFGNNPIWHFSSVATVYPSTPSDWTMWLNSPGSLSMVNVRSLFAPRAWWTLQPDSSNTLLIAGQAGSGVPYDRAVAAEATNGSFAIVYMPSSRQITIDLGQLAGPKVNARWYDPASGAYTSAGAPFTISTHPQSQSFTPAGPNASTSGTYSDWVLVLESTP